MSDDPRVPVRGYDIVGDLHGCVPTLLMLAAKLGYGLNLTPPTGRMMVFVGDLADRGTDNVLGLRMVAAAVQAGHAVAVLGNHDDALLHRLRNENAADEVGGNDTWTEIEAQPDSVALKLELTRLLSGMPLVLELAGGALVVAHAGVTEQILRRSIDDDVRTFILHGEAVGKSPEGRTMRRDWAADYRGKSFIVYGHTPQPIAVVRGRTANVDTGAYRGNALSALRWPELEIVSVESPRPGIGNTWLNFEENPRRVGD